MLNTMPRNSLYNCCDQRRLSNHRSGHRILFTACVHYRDTYLSNTRDCIQFSRVLCDCMGHIVHAVNDLLIWLHKVTCCLLHHKPASVSNVNPLPDVLKDLRDSIKNLGSPGPDVIPVLPESYTNGRSRIEYSVRSSHELYMSCQKCNYFLNSQYNSSYQHCNIHCRYNSEHDGVGTKFWHHRNGCDVTDNSGDYSSGECATDTNIQTQDSISYESNDTLRNSNFNYPCLVTKTDQRRHQVNFSSQHFSYQNIDKNNQRHQQSVGPISLTHQIQSSSRFDPVDTTGIEGSAQYQQTNVHSEHRTQKSDYELTKDIVLALRTVGDNLDARMKYKNQQTVLAVLRVSKISAGSLMLLTLKQHNAVGMIAGICLELLQHFYRL